MDKRGNEIEEVAIIEDLMRPKEGGDNGEDIEVDEPAVGNSINCQMVEEPADERLALGSLRCPLIALL